MNYKTNDLLYAFMRTLSTARPIYKEGKLTGYQEYLPKKTFLKNKKVIAGICGCTSRTINNHIDKLFEVGLLDEGIEVVEVNKKEYEYECYWFPYDYDKNYKLVNKEFLRYLIETRNAHTIRIYLYLLNKFGWKKDYIFTAGELKEALGYNKDSAVGVDAILRSLAREGIIKYEKFWGVAETANGFNGTERMKLTFVATKEEELRKI